MLIMFSPANIQCKDWSNKFFNFTYLTSLRIGKQNQNVNFFTSKTPWYLKAVARFFDARGKILEKQQKTSFDPCSIHFDLLQCKLWPPFFTPEVLVLTKSARHSLETRDWCEFSTIYLPVVSSEKQISYILLLNLTRNLSTLRPL